MNSCCDVTIYDKTVKNQNKSEKIQINRDIIIFFTITAEFTFSMLYVLIWDLLRTEVYFEYKILFF